jgi:hypothetical protein
MLARKKPPFAYLVGAFLMAGILPFFVCSFISRNFIILSGHIILSDLYNETVRYISVPPTIMIHPFETRILSQLHMYIV